MRFPWRRVVITTIVLGGFGLYWASIAFAWNPPLWLVVTGAVTGILIVSLVSVRPRSRSGSSDLYASDVYSDVYLGRRHPEHPYKDAQPASQIGDALPPDPIASAIPRSPRTPDDTTS